MTPLLRPRFRRVLAALLLLPALLAAQPSGARAGSLSGSVVDDTGAPLAGVNVEAVYQTYRADQLNNAGASIKGTAVTDAEGRYRIDLSRLPPGEYGAFAYRLLRNGQRDLVIELEADDPATFASTDEAVRNFADRIVEQSEEMPYGNAGVFVLGNAVMDFTDLAAAEVTLVEVGGGGRTYVRKVRPSGEGLVVTGIAFGTYRASVTLAGRPLRLALWGEETYGPSVTHDFTMGWLGDQFRVMAQP